jgi:hypothetical protein
MADQKATGGNTLQVTPGVDLDAEYIDEDTAGTLLFVGREDDGRIYISVNDREPVTLTPEQATEAARQILARAQASQAW